MRLGKGDAHSLSHDGRWALATDLSTHTLMMLPTGTGQPRAIPNHGFTAYAWAGFFPGDKRIVFAGTSKDGGTRMYAQDLDGSAPKPIAPHGVVPRRNTISPDGLWLASNFKGAVRLFPIDGVESRPVPGSEAGDFPIRWNGDGRVLYVRNGNRPVRIFGIEVASGRRTVLHELGPKDPVGSSGLIEIRLTPDGSSYAFGFIRTLQSLYQVSGLR